MKIMKNILLDTILCVLVSCGSLHKSIQTITSDNIRAEVAVSQNSVPQYAQRVPLHEGRDTISVVDKSGRRYILLRTDKDENGEEVATERLDAAIVTARFLNIAERGGEVLLLFDIVVPESLLNDLWQIRFYPRVKVLDRETVCLPVVITGKEYRRAQLRGYEHYYRLLEQISADSTRVVNENLLDIFIQRNLPQLAAFRRDSTFVSAQEFSSRYGITEQQAINHYTSSLRKTLVEHKKHRAQEQLLKIQDIGDVAIDTVLRETGRQFVYQYAQKIKVPSGLRSLQVIVDGEIFQQNERICSVADSEPLTFYISSLTYFVDGNVELMAVDTTYRHGVKCLENHEYKRAVELLAPYEDINTAVAYMCDGRNLSALRILDGYAPTANIHYMKAILFSRRGEEKQAVEEFLNACGENPAFIHRGNLDPEISVLVEKYDLLSVIGEDLEIVN